MGPDETREAILNVPWVASFEPDVRETLVTILKEVSEVRRLRKGHRMTREGSKGRNRGFILLTGSVRIQKSDMPDTKSKAPELLGEVMQFDPKKMRTATVWANEDLLVLRFMWEEFWAAVDRYFSEEDRILVRESMERRAWEHFTA
ncbi:MAG TPA: cyclic nucleotide-binding domain-containing protein [Candidatus Hydrogenedentes bacterium]|nr:cyclic nucleotide-binding domain-containing protein [Candidatus Hydrogenedentota bacterium]